MTDRRLKAITAISLIQIVLTSTATSSEAVRMSQDGLKLKLGEPGVVIVDARSYADWALSPEKIKGALREDYRNFKEWRYPDI